MSAYPAIFFLFIALYHWCAVLDVLRLGRAADLRGVAMKTLRAVMAALRAVLPGKEVRDLPTGRVVLQLAPGLSDKEKELTRAAAVALVEVEAEAARLRLILRLALVEGADPAVQLEALRAALAWLE